jgi:hypothetical protein
MRDDMYYRMQQINLRMSTMDDGNFWTTNANSTSAKRTHLLCSQFCREANWGQRAKIFDENINMCVKVSALEFSRVGDVLNCSKIKNKMLRLTPDNFLRSKK